MKITFTLLSSLLLCITAYSEKMDEFTKFRIDQVIMMKTKKIIDWPKEVNALFQGWHYDLDKNIDNITDAEAALEVIPEHLQKTVVNPIKVTESDKWFIVKSEGGLIAIQKGSSKLTFGYTW